MAASITFYNQFKKKINGTITWTSDTIKVMLVTASYSPDIDAHDFIDDASANEVSGTNYTAGGATLGSKTATVDNTNDWTSYDAADASWATVTFSLARYGIIYKDTGTPSTSPVVAYVDFGSNQSRTADAFTIQWHANGVFTLA